MERHWELIRAILEYTAHEGNGKNLQAPKVNGYTPEQVNYHIRLCEQAGYLDSVEFVEGSCYGVRSLLWAGHEKLDELRKGNAH